MAVWLFSTLPFFWSSEKNLAADYLSCAQEHWPLLESLKILLPEWRVSTGKSFGWKRRELGGAVWSHKAVLQHWILLSFPCDQRKCVMKSPLFSATHSYFAELYNFIRKGWEKKYFEIPNFPHPRKKNPSTSGCLCGNNRGNSVCNKINEILWECRSHLVLIPDGFDVNSEHPL